MGNPDQKTKFANTVVTESNNSSVDKIPSYNLQQKTAS